MNLSWIHIIFAQIWLYLLWSLSIKVLVLFLSGLPCVCKCVIEMKFFSVKIGKKWTCPVFSHILLEFIRYLPISFLGSCFDKLTCFLFSSKVSFGLIPLHGLCELCERICIFKQFLLWFCKEKNESFWEFSLIFLCLALLVYY